MPQLPLSESAFDTRAVMVEAGAIRRTAALFREQFGERTARIIADTRTWEAAGAQLDAHLRDTGIACAPAYVFAESDLPAEMSHVTALEAAVTGTDVVPVAVGAGTVNDLVKLASHRTARPYMVVATAASMDGYNAFGASITHRGSKQTFDCPAPRAVVADLDVLCAAPPELSAAGYADLLAKVPAGADWLLADALGVDALDPAAWSTVQAGLKDALAHPEGVGRGDREAIRRLTEGLLASGFAMQISRTSRPASGAEHQFSHLWDMEHHTHGGRVPLHGLKVGIATLAVTRLYEALLEQPLEQLDVGACCAAWSDLGGVDRVLRRLFTDDALLRKAGEETRAKWVDRETLAGHLTRVREVWPELRGQLRHQLVPSAEVERRLRAVGAPTDPQEIGLSPERLRSSFMRAYHLRRRYTVLDLAVRTGTLERCLASVAAAEQTRHL